MLMNHMDKKNGMGIGFSAAHRRGAEGAERNSLSPNGECHACPPSLLASPQ